MLKLWGIRRYGKGKEVGLAEQLQHEKCPNERITRVLSTSDMGTKWGN